MYYDPGDDSASTSWNPQPVKTTIEFRGMQATYTFPVGVTTLWWFAPATSSFDARGVTNTTESVVRVASEGHESQARNSFKSRMMPGL